MARLIGGIMKIVRTRVPRGRRVKSPSKKLVRVVDEFIVGGRIPRMQAIELGGGSQRQITRNACPQDTHTTMSYPSWDDTEPLHFFWITSTR